MASMKLFDAALPTKVARGRKRKRVAAARRVAYVSGPSFLYAGFP
jgi:hypothetical protein